MGECFFWYRPTQVIPDKGPLNDCVCMCMCWYIWISLLSPVLTMLLLLNCEQAIESELEQMNQFVSLHVSDHSGFHYQQFLLNCLQASLDDERFSSRLKSKLQLTQELIKLYPGHEAIWYHRSVDCCSAG